MKFRSEVYGQYEIRSGLLSGRWAANAFRRKVLAATASGVSREDAIAQVKQILDRSVAQEREERDHDGAPSASAYERAFTHLLPGLSASYTAMLRAHLAAPDQLTSAMKLAEAAGYEGYEGTNLHYGKLGKRIAREVDFDPETRADGTEIWTTAIARDPSTNPDIPDTSLSEALERNIDTQHFEWQMRPQVAQALRSLGF